VLSLAILWGHAGTRHPKLDTVRKEEGAGGVVKLMSIVALNTLDGTTKLCGHMRKSESVRNVSDLWRSENVHE
jgi:hypothetical protein